MPRELADDAGAATYAMTVAYDGRAFFGWQRHGSRRTIQGTLETALAQAAGVRAAVLGSGRTDRGVHARGQVASVSLPAGLDATDMLARLNAALPEDVRVLGLARAPEGFNALTSCTGKRYRYEIWLDEHCPPDREGRVWHSSRALDVGAMREAASHVVGRHDFASFATKTKFKPKSTVRTLHALTITEDGPRLTVVMSADGFLYKMVRNIVRSLVKVGEGKLTPVEFQGVLAAKSRAAAVGTAPASGLHLDEVFYDGEDDG